MHVLRLLNQDLMANDKLIRNQILNIDLEPCTPKCLGLLPLNLNLLSALC